MNSIQESGKQTVVVRHASRTHGKVINDPRKIRFEEKRLTRWSAYAKPTAVHLEDKLSDDHKRMAACTMRLATLPSHLLANRLALQVMIELTKFDTFFVFFMFHVDRVERRNDEEE
jgi:hypothetical protein